MATYSKSLLLKEAAKIGSLPADTPLPKMPGWTPNHIRSGRDWMGESPQLERFLDSYLQRKNMWIVDKNSTASRGEMID